ncbi:hypothetical protein FACS1894139_00870 [Planctomycetales bacterium]|nr:hypothetical protein FACS1894107_06510 [Planctomycetales bacterium]GHT00725.1 hypothetical protein FACS1894108_13480 [Planctomycetales bacterium]GHT02540.1 hypothetical protein FACS1894139_00870 [Planctomycetales bacterium]GHV22189.1 hypothetical protein AGMMS49959_12580 [Planctomycetales bacterium]
MTLHLDREIYRLATERAGAENVSVSKLINEALKKVFTAEGEARRERLRNLYGSIDDPTFMAPPREFV